MKKMGDGMKRRMGKGASDRDYIYFKKTDSKSYEYEVLYAVPVRPSDKGWWTQRQAVHI
jgi:hypothetical protein